MPTYENLELTPLANEGGDADTDEMCDYTTAGMVNFCLRSGCLDSEYHLALRTQELRKLALRLMDLWQGEGYPLEERWLDLVDVEASTMTTKRFNKINNG